MLRFLIPFLACSLFLSAEEASPSPEQGYWGEQFAMTFVPRQRTRIEVQVRAKVQKVHRQLGESFEEGELLIELDDTVLLAHRRRAVAAVSSAEAEYQARRILKERAAASESDVKVALSRLESAEADLILAEEGLAQARIHAPYAGKIAQVSVVEHEFTPGNQPILTIIDDQVLVARILVRAETFSKIAVGHRVRLLVDGVKDPVLGIVNRMDAFIDPVSGTARVEVDIPNADRLFFAGISGVAQFFIQEESRVAQ